MRLEVLVLVFDGHMDEKELYNSYMLFQKKFRSDLLIMDTEIDSYGVVLT